MDQMTVKLPDDWGEAGDEVVLFGPAGDGVAGGSTVAWTAPEGPRIDAPETPRILCEEMARMLGTINYEIACDVAPRVVRTYRGVDADRLRQPWPPATSSRRRRSTRSRGRRSRRSAPARPAGWSAAACATSCWGGAYATSTSPWTAGPRPLARALGDRFGGGVYATSDVFGTWRVVVGDLHIDIAALRGGPLGDPPDPQTRALRLEADLRARDVTVDALARPLDGDDIVDPLSGLSDLAAGRLRLCSPASLDDDPLRVLRLARLARVFDLVPDAAATEAAFRAAPGLARVSGERVRDELCSLLGHARTPRSRSATSPCGARWRSCSPRSTACAAWSRTRTTTSTSSSTRSRRSPTSSAWSRSSAAAGSWRRRRRRACPASSRSSPSRGPSCCTTSASPWCASSTSRDGSSSGTTTRPAARCAPTSAGASTSATGSWSTSGRSCASTCGSGFLTREQPLTRRALARYRRDVSPWVFESVVVSLCDRLATRGEKTSLTSMARHYRLARTVWTGVSKAPAPQLLSGDDVMTLLGLEPGPAVGQALDALEEEVEAGEVADADGARAFLLEWWERRDDDAAAMPARPPAADA